MRNVIRRKADPAAYLKAVIRTWRYRLLDACGAVKPLKLRIGLTNRCNARCIMCNVWKQRDENEEWKTRELRVDEIDAICTRNARFFSRLNHISLTGGEPTLRSDFVEIFRVLHKHFPDMNVSFNSNGFATDKVINYVEQVLAFHPRLTVMISVDGVGEVHDQVRGVPGVFARVSQTVERLVALRQSNRLMKVEINYVMTPRNAAECAKVHEFCRERRISFNPIYCVQGELYFNEEHDNVTLTEEARACYVQQFEQMLVDDDSLQTREIMDQLVGRPRDFNCWGARILFLVEENGDVFPNGGCPSDFKLGNLRDFDYSFERLLASNYAKGVLARTKPCRICRLSCETMTTLQHPEALEAYRKSREMPVRE